MNHNHMMIYLYSLLKLPVTRLPGRKACFLPGLIALLLIIWAVLPSFGSRPSEVIEAQKTLSATFRTEHFTVRYDPGKTQLSKSLASVAESELIRISEELGYNLEESRPFPLYIYPTHRNFIRAGGLEISAYTVGTANSMSEAISVDASGAFALPAEIIEHEITHAVIFRMLGPNVSKLPLWLNEGLAKYQSSDFNDDDKALVTDAASQGTLIPLPRLANTFPKDRTALAYAESASAVYYLVEKHGTTAPRIILLELADTGSIDKAMTKATGMDLAGYESEWFNHSMKRHWPVRAAQIGLQVVSALMAVLVILAFLARRRKKIQAAKEWEWEQFNEKMRKQLDDGGR